MTLRLAAPPSISRGAMLRITDHRNRATATGGVNEANSDLASASASPDSTSVRSGIGQCLSSMDA